MPSGMTHPAATAEGAEPDSTSGESAVAADDTRPCPMCGAQIKRAAKRCRFCGETLVEQHIEAGYILRRTWELYKNQLGILIATLLIVGGISAAVSFTGSMIQQGISFALVGGGGGGGGGGGNNAAAGIAMVIMSLSFTAINMAFSAYLQAGLHIVLLRVARGETVEIGELFTGGPYFWRFFWGTLLFQIMVGVGLLLLIVPGIILL